MCLGVRTTQGAGAGKKPAWEGAGRARQPGRLSRLEGQQELANQVRRKGKVQARQRQKGLTQQGTPGISASLWRGRELRKSLKDLQPGRGVWFAFQKDPLPAVWGM